MKNPETYHGKDMFEQRGGESQSYEILSTEKMRNSIIKRSNDLVSLVVDEKYDNVVFLDRSSRPAYWAFRASWQLHFPAGNIPSIHHLNTGRKGLRQKYMYGVGDAITQDENGNLIGQFVGIFDSEENINLFLERVGTDKTTMAQIEVDLGEEGKQKLSGGSVLVVDDTEFEGVQRLFAMQVLSDIYNPKKISYFEWALTGGQLPSKSHGLSYQESDSFIACLTDDEEALMRAEKARNEIERLILGQ